MRTSSLIGHVVEVLDIVRSGRRPADAVVREFFRTRHYLGSSDRRYIAERTYDILRHEDLLSAYCGGAGLRQPFPSVALAVAHEARIHVPPAAGEQLAADFGGIWRAVAGEPGCDEFITRLREATLPERSPEDPASWIALMYSMPGFVVADWLTRFSPEETEEICAASNGSAPVTIRVNTLKCTRDKCREALSAAGVGSTPTPLSPVGLTLEKRVNIQGLQPFKSGWFEMQDEGSQILSYLTGVRPGMTVIDACAGGGGKSLHLAALMENRGRLIAADVDRKKLDNFLERAGRAGVSIAETVVVAPDSDEPLPGVVEGEDAGTEVAPARSIGADVVLIDAPCSGVGTFRRSPWLKRTVTENASANLAKGQRRLLERYAASTRPGGHLIYTTCTLVRQENRGTVECFTASHPEFEEVSARGILEGAGIQVGAGRDASLELFPHRSGTDGFFAAVMRRVE